MSAIQNEFVFGETYQASALADFPGWPGERVFYYPGATAEGGSDGILVRVSPAAGDPWLGLFEFGYRSTNVVTGLYGAPDQKSLCVVSAGRGYVVNANEPETWSEIPVFPIEHALASPKQGLLIFADRTAVAAYGSDGLRWKTDQLSWDGLDIESVDADTISGRAWDDPEQRHVEFTVDALTGAHKGGARPPPPDSKFQGRSA